MNQKGKEFLQYIVGMLIYNVLKCFHLFPIKENKVFFSSYKGSGYSCNPKYFSEYLLKNSVHNCQMIWGIRKTAKVKIPNGIKKVSLLSVMGFYHCLTSRVVIDNCGLFPYIPYRKKQFCINTWHGGGAYKKVDAITLHKSRFKMRLDENKAKATNLVIASCRESLQLFPHSALHYSGKIACIGMPRNDVLFDTSFVLEKAREVKKKFGIERKKVVLYAPTFRGDEKSKEVFDGAMQMDQVQKELNLRFGGEYIIAMRAHHYLSGRYKKPEGVLDVSTYPDIMELLCATDVLITDYSSIMWDFAILERPIFLYVPDQEKYSAERNFYVPMEKWHFPIAKSNDELYQEIRKFTWETGKLNARLHQLEFGTYEKGNACKKLLEIIQAL